jgi:predicted DNA binding CopG/RHH family protein
MEIAAADFNDIFWEPPESEFQPLLDFENEVLQEAPHNDVALLTQRIKRSFLDYVRQGIMLDAVRRYRLYKRQYRNFAEYCKNALGRSPYYCRRIIDAAQICLRLIKSEFKILPTSVAQALPLLKFATVDEYGDSQLQDKWQTVLENFPPQNITAAKIAEALDENPEDRAKQIRIGGKAYQLLKKKAAEAGMAISKYLEILIDGESPDDEPPPPDDDCPKTELTVEQEEILDKLDAEFQKNAVEAIGKTDKAIARIGCKKLSRYYQKAIKPAANRSDQASDTS